ncbi:MAG: MarR family transcriptional regulator [Verrucomicrobia bacterium]|nr:MarR family transcriptional regulator [Verrucomicrobiota bacterium]
MDILGIDLWQTATFWRREVDAALHPLELTYTQFVLLSALSELHEVSQAELARHTNMDITMTSQVIRALEQKGFIERHQQEGDDRSKFPYLTEEGLELIEQAIPVVEEVDNAFFSCLRSDTKRCSDILQKLQKEYCK